jgi:hypothetical protein
VGASSPSGREQRSYSPHSIAAIVTELAGQGIDSSCVLEGAGLASSRTLTRYPTGS